MTTSKDAVTITNQAGQRIPMITFPDGRRVELGPGDVANDPDRIVRGLMDWFCEWKQRMEDVEFTQNENLPVPYETPIFGEGTLLGKANDDA